MCLNLQPPARRPSLQLFLTQPPPGTAHGSPADHPPTDSTPRPAAPRCRHRCPRPPRPACRDVPTSSCAAAGRPFPSWKSLAPRGSPLPPHVFPTRASLQNASRLRDQLRPGHRGEHLHHHHNKHNNTPPNSAPLAPVLIQAPSSTSKTVSTWPRTRMRPTPRRRFPTPSRASRPRSAPRAHMAGPLLPPSRSRPCTLASTRRCCTTPSTATLALSTSATCTASPCSYMRSSATLPTRTVPSSSGATPTRGVRLLQTYRFRAAVNMPRPRKRCLYSGMLHGAHPVMAASPGPGAHRPDGPPLHALPRRRLQPGRLCAQHPGRHLRCVEGKGRRPMRTQGLQPRGVCPPPGFPSHC